MDTGQARQTSNDMGMVAQRIIRLDGYKPVGSIHGCDYHLKFRVRGDKTKLFIIKGGGLSRLVDRFLELVSLLIGEFRIDSITSQTADAMFHGLGGELADLLREGRRNCIADSDFAAQMGNGERSRMPESDSSESSNASVETPIRPPEDYKGTNEAQERPNDLRKPGGMPTNNPLGWIGDIP